MAAPTILPVPTILEAYKLGGGYSLQDRATKNTLFGGMPVQTIPQKITFVGRRVQYRYDINPSDTTLRDTANTLWKLLGKYGVRAVNSLDQGGVVVTQIPGIANYLVTLRNYPQFVVGSFGSPMVADDTVLEIFDDLAVPQGKDGQVEIHLDGGELGELLMDRSSFDAVYTTGKYTVTFTNPVRDGMLIMPKYPIRNNLVSSSIPSPTTNVEYTATLVDFQIRTLLNSDGNIFTIPAATQGVLTINLTGESSLDERLAAVWEYYVNNIGGTITLAQSNGGIIYQTFAVPMDANIVISGNNALQGVQIIGTGQVGSTIILKATFNYAPFGI